MKLIREPLFITVEAEGKYIYNEGEVKLFACIDFQEYEEIIEEKGNRGIIEEIQKELDIEDYHINRITFKYDDESQWSWEL